VTNDKNHKKTINPVIKFSMVPAPGEKKSSGGNALLKAIEFSGGYLRFLGAIAIRRRYA